MDMNVPISPIVLQAFYMLLLKEAVVCIVVAGIIWFLARRFLPGGNFFASDRGGEARETASAALRIRAWVVVVLGGLWILDGFLQAQPAMSNQFLPGMVQPMIAQLPGFLPSLLNPPLYIWSVHPLFFDSLATWLQIVMGVFIVFGPWRRIGRLALYVSIGWALVIWVFGEAFGSLLNGATWLTGAPGSALMYVLAAVLLLQPAARWLDGRVWRWLTVSIGVMWLLNAALQAWPGAGFWQPGGMKGAELPMAQMSQPAWMAAPLYWLANLLDTAPALWDGIFVAVLASLGVGWLVRPRLRGAHSVHHPVFLLHLVAGAGFRGARRHGHRPEYWCAAAVAAVCRVCTGARRTARIRGCRRDE